MSFLLQSTVFFYKRISGGRTQSRLCIYRKERWKGCKFCLMYPIPILTSLLLLLYFSLSNNYWTKIFQFCVWYFCKTIPHVTRNICVLFENWQLSDSVEIVLSLSISTSIQFCLLNPFTLQVSTCASQKTPMGWQPPTQCLSDNPSWTTSRSEVFSYFHIFMWGKALATYPYAIKNQR